jgi:MFS family permease
LYHVFFKQPIGLADFWFLGYIHTLFFPLSLSLRRETVLAWIYWVLGAFFYFYQFFFRSLFPTLADELAGTLGVSIPDLGLFFSSGLLSYSLMQLPGGVLFDRFGPRVMMSLGIGSVSFGVLLISWAQSLGVAVLGRLFFGVGAAFGFLGATTLISLHFKPSLMPVLLGSTVFLGSLGGAFSRMIFEPLTLGDWDWQKALFFMSLVGFGATGLFIWLIPSPGQRPISHGSLPLGQTFKEIFTHPQIMLCSMTSFFAYCVISVIADSWGVKAFQVLYNVPREVANQTPLFFYIPFAFGSLGFSALATGIGSSRRALLTELFVSVLLLLGLFWDPEWLSTQKWLGVDGFLVLTALLGFHLGGVALTFPIGCAYAAPGTTGTTVGVMNLFCMFSGGIYAQFLGSILEFYWDGTLGDTGLPLYSSLAYQKALTPLIGAAVLAYICLFFVREKNKT